MKRKVFHSARRRVASYRTCEALEPRLPLTTTFFFDFGAALPAGGLNTDVDAFLDVAGPNTGTDLVMDTGMAAGADLNIARLNYDFDGNGTPGEVSDVTALATAALPLIQRALEPYDINAVIVSATSLADVATTMAANAGDASGEFDAYNFVTTFTSTTLVNAMTNPTGSVGVFSGLFGLASRPDFDGAAGNFVDEATQSYADAIFASTPGVVGTAAFNANLAQRMAYTGTHEGAHTMGLRHSQGLPASGDIIRLGSNTRDNPFMITRFDLARQNGPSPVNNYDMFAADLDIGLRDADTNAIPDLAFVTGTGAHDLIDLNANGATMIDVDVEAFSDQGMTSSLGTEIYSVDLTTDTESDVLIDAGINNDEVQVEATIAADMRLRGGTGIDGVASENDLLTIMSGGLTGTFSPGPDGINGSVSYGGGAHLVFSEFEDVEADNVAIVVAPLTLSSNNINEDDTVNLSGEFVNIDTLDTHMVTIDWGDGSLDTVLNLSAGDRTFMTSHQYLDDNPSITSSDNYTITVTVEDEDGDSGEAEAVVVTVNNVDPVLSGFMSDATFEDKGEEGEPVNILANFTDVGTLDTHTAVVDWGDGTVEPVTVVPGAPGTGTVTGSHAYAAGGIYTITVTLTDDDTGDDSADTTAVITGVGLNNGILYVIGSSDDDEVSANRTGNGELKVKATFIPDDFRSFDEDDVDKIIAYLCEGDDLLVISNRVTIPATIHGDGGNDHLNAGGGTTVLLGGDGDDELVGQGAFNVLIGGLGEDKLTGGKVGDVLIGGSTTSDLDDDALMAAATAWAANDTYANRVSAIDAALTVLDDGNVDTLTGSSGEDLFYDGLGDALTDVKPFETII